LARGKEGENYRAVVDPPLPAMPAGSDTFELVQLNSDLAGRLHVAKKDVSTAAITVDLAAAPVQWQLLMTNPANIDGLLKTGPSEVEDLFLVLAYRWE
jgi:hypothetical protein